MTDKTLVVAFDGLDYNLINKFGLVHVQQEEFGTIDVTSDVVKRVTSELYTSFITGQPPSKHGIVGLNIYNKRAKIVNTLIPQKLQETIPYAFDLNLKLNQLIGGHMRKPEKTDYTTPTIFDEIENSKALYVPGYNPGIFWKAGLKTQVLDYTGGDMDEAVKVVKQAHRMRKRNLFDRMKNENDELLMCHFHYPDYIQHLYGTDFSWNIDKLRQMYNKMDELANKIRIEARQQGFENILFLSDHGTLRGSGEYEHNPNAFYSSNNELGLGKPSIIDFHDIILDWAGGTRKEIGEIERENDAKDKNEEVRKKLKQLGY